MTESLQKTDDQIKQQVLAELKWDTLVSNSNTEVGVIVHHGVVTLKGTLDSWAKRCAVTEAAHRVVGVLDVVNNLEVKPPYSFDKTDEDIAQAVRRALDWDFMISDKQIRTTVSKGMVTLMGTVDYWYQRDSAERAVRNLLGVVGVINNIELAPAKVASSTIEKSIQDALSRQATQDAKQVKISVATDGSVTLSGSVHSWADKQVVLNASRRTAGVRNVVDGLSINL